MKSDVQRKLVMPRNGSQSITNQMGDGTISGGVVIVPENGKNYLEDGEGQGLVGLILSNSSKSGIEAGKETVDKDRYASNDDKDLELAQYNS